MPRTPALRLSAGEFAAIIFALVFVLFLRSYVQLELQERGTSAAYSRDLAYLVIPPLLLLLLVPVLRECRGCLLELLRRDQVTLRLVISAIALGALMRIVWWSQLITRVSFGLVRNVDPDALVGPIFTFACPPLQVIGLGFFVTALLIPVTEEVVHRGLIQSALVHKGRGVSILVSALVFALFHTPSSFLFVFIMGLVLGLQFRNARTLWAPIITHATYNGLIQIDWRCLRSTWNPTADQLPLLGPGGTALCLLFVSSVIVIWLISGRNIGVREAPRY